MIIVAGTIDIQADKRERAAELAIAMQRATRAEEGCITYTFYSDLENSAQFHVYEEWESQAHLDAHFKTEHMRVFNQSLPEVVAGKADITIYEVVSAKKL